MVERKLTVWIFQAGEPLHCDDELVRPMRAMNLANALVEKGHYVVLWSSSFYHQEKRHRSSTLNQIQINPNLEIRLIPSPGYKRNISFSRLFDHLRLSLNLKKELNLQSAIPDAAFVGYPPIETAAVMIRWLKKRDIPTLLDVKDQWPSLLVESVPKIARPLARLVLSPYYFVARRAMRHATGICAMSDSFLNWAVGFAGRGQNKVDRVVPLTSPKTSIEEALLLSARQWWSAHGIQRDKKCRIMFVGSFSRAFDFDAIFIAAGELIEQQVDCEFILCGDGDLAETLKVKAENYPNVSIISWIDRAKIIALAECSSAVVAPYKNTPDFIASIPNKVIDALLLGLPLLSPLQGEVEKLINIDNVGLCYGSESGNSLADCINNLVDKPSLIQEFSGNAKRLYDDKFSFENVYGGLVSHIESMATTSNSPNTDKLIEKKRYDLSAENQLLSDDYDTNVTTGSELVSVAMRQPYLIYEKFVREFLSDGKKVLEIGAGIGVWTSTLLSAGANVYTIDISGYSLSVLRKRLAGFGKLHTQVADMEYLPFDNESFDVVTSAGSLSYGDNEKVMNEIYRVLKKDGVFICVDSLSHNPIYRFNRWIHYRRGYRTLSTLQRMPNILLLKSYSQLFGSIQVHYFGAISWLVPLLKSIISDSKTAKLSDRFDRLIRVKKSAFKFVMVAKKV